MGIFIGYATFYLIRNNVPLVTPILTKELGFSNAAIGALSTALLLAYGFSKFLTAMISDRSNARLFLPIGLVLSGVANILLALTGYMGEGAGAAGYGAAIASIMATIMVFNGIFQGMGWPPSGRVLVNWFSTSERGAMRAASSTLCDTISSVSGTPPTTSVVRCPACWWPGASPCSVRPGRLHSGSRPSSASFWRSWRGC